MTRSSRLILSALLLGTSLVVTGCTQRIGDLTFVSTRNIDLSNADIDIRKGRRVKGKDCKYALLGLIPLGLPTLQGAVDDALDKGDGNVMVDQVTSSSNFWFILVSQFCIEAEGTVVRTGG
jgi:hypothetical protein